MVARHSSETRGRGLDWLSDRSKRLIVSAVAVTALTACGPADAEPKDNSVRTEAAADPAEAEPIVEIAETGGKLATVEINGPEDVTDELIEEALAPITTENTPTPKAAVERAAQILNVVYAAAPGTGLDSDGAPIAARFDEDGTQVITGPELTERAYDTIGDSPTKVYIDYTAYVQEMVGLCDDGTIREDVVFTRDGISKEGIDINEAWGKGEQTVTIYNQVVTESVGSIGTYERELAAEVPDYKIAFPPDGEQITRDENITIVKKSADGRITIELPDTAL